MFSQLWKLQVQMISCRDSQNLLTLKKERKNLNMHIFCYKREEGNSVWWEVRVPLQVWGLG